MRTWTDKHVVNNDGCWIYDGYISTTGYGMRSYMGRPTQAHRAYYRHYIGEIPEGNELDHLCRVRSCVNPDHLEPVTRLENSRRGEGGRARAAQMRAKTHCAQGHAFDQDNTLIAKNGWRRCKACMAAQNKKWRESRVSR